MGQAVHGAKHAVNTGGWGLLWLPWLGGRGGQGNWGVSSSERKPGAWKGLAPCLSVSVGRDRAWVWNSHGKLQGGTFQLRLEEPFVYRELCRWANLYGNELSITGSIQAAAAPQLDRKAYRVCMIQLRIWKFLSNPESF